MMDQLENNRKKTNKKAKKILKMKEYTYKSIK
jgi:hypothetical protein